MRPSREEILAACPEVDPRLVEEHLSRLGNRYFQRFSRSDLHEHLRALNGVSPDHPVELLLAPPDGARLAFTLLAFDYPGAFSLVTGVLTGVGYSIFAGDVFTYVPARAPGPAPRRGARRARRSVDPLRRRRVVNHFSGVVERRIPIEAWTDELVRHMEELFQALEKGDEASLTAAKHAINEGVVRRLNRMPTPASPEPVLIQGDNRHEDFTRLRIVSEDTPAFLYSLTHAFSLHGLVIEHVRIRTLDGRIEDEIDVVDGNHRKIEDADLLGGIKLSVLLTKQFTFFLGKAPDPYTALVRFKQFVEDILRLPGREEWIEALANPRTLKDLALLLGTSDFLWEDFIRLQYETLLPILRPLVGDRRFSQDSQTLPHRLQEALDGAEDPEEQKRRLNAFKDQEIFLIDLDHILNPETDFAELARRLTRLAELVVSTAAELAYRDLVARFGEPETAAGLKANYALLGLGKLGGAALGYASDIEFLLVYSDSGHTSGSPSISNGEFFDRLVQSTAQFIRAKREGIFQVDLRLRPHGNVGPLGCSLESFCQYDGAEGQAHAYERLALVRLRAIGGNRALGQRVERIRDEMIYESQSIRLEDLRELREKQFQEKTREGVQNAKFDPGGLVDLEYNVQILQVLHGSDNPALRTPRVHQALAALTDAGLLRPEETAQVLAAYEFQRELINAMRMLRGSAKDLFLPPSDSLEYEHLARRMGYHGGGALRPAHKLSLDYETHTAAVRAFAERHFGRTSLPGPATGTVADLVLADDVPDALAERVLTKAGFRNVRRALTNLRDLAGSGDRRTTFARLALLATDILAQTPDPDMALNNWERFVRARPSPEFHYNLCLGQPMRLELLLTLFAGSQFLADTLVRHPGFLDWITIPENLHQIRGRGEMEDELLSARYDASDHDRWLNRLRRLRRREILRIGARDQYLRAPLPDITLELSYLAEAVTSAALARVWERLRGEQAPPIDLEAMEARFCLLAFGKLGGRELNYSSDIDLLGLFDLAPGFPAEAELEPPEIKGLFSKVMERVRDDLSRHTAEGSAYRVDLRLRPYGRAGELVPSLTGLVDYYRRGASLWELQAALKIRPIAGNQALGERLLEQIRPLLLAPRRREEVARSVEHLRR